MKKRTTKRAKASTRRRRVMSQFFDFVVHDDSMEPTIHRNDHVTIDSKVNSFDKLCRGIYLVKPARNGRDWELVRPVPWMKDGRIEAIVGTRQDNVGGMLMRDIRKLQIIGRALIIHRQIDRAIAS